MKGKAPSLAVVFGGGSGSKSGAAEPDKDDEYKEGASLDEYRSYLETAFPEDDWSDDKRVEAMKSFVMACMP